MPTHASHKQHLSSFILPYSFINIYPNAIRVGSMKTPFHFEIHLNEETDQELRHKHLLCDMYTHAADDNLVSCEFLESRVA
jgi:hypothetical protein